MYILVLSVRKKHLKYKYYERFKRNTHLGYVFYLPIITSGL